MASLGDAVMQFPVSASFNPRVHMRVIQQAMSGTFFDALASTSGTLALPANPSRIGFIVANDSPSVAYFGYGFNPTSQRFSGIYPALDKSAPNTTSYQHEHVGSVVYTGDIYVTHQTATGSVHFTELT